MAASDGDSKIVITYKPTLSHMSLTKVAIGLYKEFSVQTLRHVFSEMNLPEFKKGNSKNCPILHNIVKEKLLLIPTNLRKEVLEAVERVQNEVSQWRLDHRDICGLDDAKFTFFWRSDGTVDRVKTAQELVVNQNIDIKNRFDLACTYCIVESVQTLWKELKAYGDTENYETSFNGIEHFWVKWMSEGTHIPWTEAARQYTEPYWIVHPMASAPRFSSIFRELMPEDRRKYFNYLYFSDADDLRSCLYTVTKEEQEEIMNLFASRVLRFHMQWPLKSLFLQTADKAWKFLDNSSFCVLLEQLFECKNKSDLDWDHLAIEFWNRSPRHFKEIAKENECLNNKLEFIQERVTKRKVATDDQASSKRFKK